MSALFENHDEIMIKITVFHTSMKYTGKSCWATEILFSPGLCLSLILANPASGHYHGNKKKKLTQFFLQIREHLHEGLIAVSTVSGAVQPFATKTSVTTMLIRKF